MTRSLRVRFFLAAALANALALAVASFGLVSLYENEVTARVERELNNHLLQLAGAISEGTDGSLRLSRTMADPRFAQPLSGLYWQIDWEKQEPLRSRSLWDAQFPSPKGPQTPGDDSFTELEGPDGKPTLALTRTISVERQGEPYPVRLLVAIDEAEVTAPVSSFRRVLTGSLLLLGIALTVAAWSQIRIGLQPLDAVRRRLGEIHAGKATRLAGDYPAEIAPLVSELNGLLDRQERTIERARARAGDLAHGLKTPLTVIDAIGRDIGRKGERQVADDLAEQTDTMRRHVERELVRSRLAAGHGVPERDLKGLVDRILSTMRRLPRGNEIAFEATVPDGVAVLVDRDDLTELIGNLVDNARKWARSRVVIDGRSRADGLAMTISDDGPGVAEGDLPALGERGRRLDERSQGSGIGLAIVHDIVDAYGMRVAFSRAKIGGLAVELLLPTKAAA
ncbi:MAG: HAMP domain-containing sensor histidine kinase [Hyphomicrobiales bacterium]